MTVPRQHGPDRSGVVAAFDEHVGLGSIALDDGREVSFHATQLTDGTAQIERATPVRVHVVRWHRGELEATSISRA